jgi:hypothetical protein
VWAPIFLRFMVYLHKLKLMRLRFSLTGIIFILALDFLIFQLPKY